MGAIIGVLVGYALGARAGEKGWAEFSDAWKVIEQSRRYGTWSSDGLSVARERPQGERQVRRLRRGARTEPPPGRVGA